MVRSNAIGHLCSSDSLHNIPGPLPFPLPDGVIGLLARCEPSCGPSLSSYCTYLLPSNDTLSLHFFIPTLCLADSASVVRNGDRGSRRTYESRGWRRACAASRHLLRALNMGFPQCVETRAGILNMPGHRVGGDNVRHHGLGVSRLRGMKTMGLLGRPRVLDELVPAFQFKSISPTGTN
jgi:hypothetical protein